MQYVFPARPLVRAVVPAAGWLGDAALVLGFSGFIALSAQVSILLPFMLVPFSGQTLAVLLTGAVLGSRLGSLAVLVYLAEGLMGLPVFAGAASAWTPTRTALPTIIGPTAGYLFAFPIAAFVVGWLAERGWDRSVWRAVIAMLIGNIVIYTGGLLWLARLVGAEQAIPLGLLPFIPGDLIKIALAAAALPGAWSLVQRRKDAGGGSLR